MLFSYGMAKTVASPKPFSRDLAEMFRVTGAPKWQEIDGVICPEIDGIVVN